MNQFSTALRPIKACLLLCFLFFSSTTFGQLEESLDTEFVSFKDAANKQGDSTIVAPRVLNAFFNQQISEVLTESGDLAFNKGYAVLDVADDQLLIGGTFNNIENATQKLSHVFNVGIRARISDGFATVITKNGSFASNIGANLKYTRVHRGTIVRKKTSNAGEFQQIRDTIHAKLNYELAREFEKQKALNAQSEVSLLNDLAKTYREKFAKAEAIALKDQKLIERSHTCWTTFEAYIPFTEAQFLTAQTFSSPIVARRRYEPELDVSFNYLLVWNNWQAQFKSHAGAQLNNTATAHLIDDYSFSSFLNLGGTDSLSLAQLETEDILVGDFTSFASGKVGAEATCLFYDLIGISAAIESELFDYKVDGSNYSSINWKLGIPVTLTGKKKDKPVNFELQWRETRGVHLVGINVGIPISGPVY